jgi:hypothetical protein
VLILPNIRTVELLESYSIDVEVNRPSSQKCNSNSMHEVCS